MCGAMTAPSRAVRLLWGSSTMVVRGRNRGSLRRQKMALPRSKLFLRSFSMLKERAQMFEAKHSEIATVPMQRRDVLAGLADPGPLCSAGAVMLPFALFRTLPARRWSVRFLGGDICFDDCPKTGPFNFSGAINTCSVREGLNGDVLALRLGPDEWLLIDSSVRGHSETEGRDEAAALAALDAAKWTIVDISHRNAAMRVSGGRARDVLNTGCLLDLDDR